MGPVLALTALGALLRFPTLDAKSFWHDEAVTVSLLRHDLWETLSLIPSSESTPPLYYVLAWLWTQATGTGEVGLRSLSALFGTALVPVAYRLGALLISRRGALVAGALVAVNPFLVWYSQEARSYALFALFTGLAMLFFLQSLRGEPSQVWKWTGACAAALLTHYFALFLVAPQAAWLLVKQRRRTTVLACALLALVAAAILPLALEQRSELKTGFIADTPLHLRMPRMVEFLIGYDAPNPRMSAAGAALLALVALWLLVRHADARIRARARVPAAIALGVMLLALMAALIGFDYVLARNVIPALVPFLLVLAAGFSVVWRRGVGLGAAAILCVGSVGLAISSWNRPKYGVEDWRRAATAIGPARGPRLIVVTPPSGAVPLTVYMPRTHRAGPGRVKVAEVVLLALPRLVYDGRKTLPPPPPPRGLTPPTGFRLVERRAGERFSLLRFRATEPRPVTPAEGRRSHITEGAASALTQTSDSSLRPVR